MISVPANTSGQIKLIKKGYTADSTDISIILFEMIDPDRCYPSDFFHCIPARFISHVQASYANIKRLEKPLHMNEEWIQQNNTHRF